MSSRWICGFGAAVTGVEYIFGACLSRVDLQVDGGCWFLIFAAFYLWEDDEWEDDE